MPPVLRSNSCPCVHRYFPNRKGFTLIELLLVIGVAALLMSILPPALRGILSGRGVEKGINSTRDVLGYARSQAMTRRTRVWVPLKNVINAEGNTELRMVVLISKNGLNDYGPANLKAASNTVVIPGVKLVSYREMPEAVKKAPGNDSVTMNEGNYVSNWVPSSFPDMVVGNDSFKNTPFISFDAEGQVATSTSSDPYGLMFQNQVCVGLAPSQGSGVQANANDGAILSIFGGSSRTSVVRP